MGFSRLEQCVIQEWKAMHPFIKVDTYIRPATEKNSIETKYISMSIANRKYVMALMDMADYLEGDRYKEYLKMMLDKQHSKLISFSESDFK